MKNREYWQRRFLALEADQVKNAKNLAERLEKEWFKTTKEIEKEITSWYGKFAVDNKIDMATAKAMLSFSELKEFKWDVEEYISKAKENVLNGSWQKELGNAYAKQRISRLQAIDIQLRERIEELYNKEYGALKDLAESTYKDTYYKSIFEVGKGFGVGSSFNLIDNRRIEKLLATGWTSDNKSFSDRIWTSKEKLISTLQTELTQNIILGKAPDKLIKSITKTMNTSKNNAARLVMTETSFFYSTAQEDAYKELEVEKYEYLATLDMDTSEICQSMDGQVFDMKDYKVGLTAPPLHPWCRSVTVPYFSDSFGERWARGEDGKSYTVPSDMTYEQWSKDISSRIYKLPNVKEKVIKTSKEYAELVEVRSKEDFEKILDNANISDKLKMNMRLANEFTPFEERLTYKYPFAYSTEDDIIIYNRNQMILNADEVIYARIHELTHLIDYRYYNSWDKYNFIEAIEESRSIVINNKSMVEAWFEKGGIYEKDIPLSDIISAITNSEVQGIAGHTRDYWKQSKTVPMEIFANINSIELLEYESKQEFRGILSILYEAYKEVTK